MLFHTLFNLLQNELSFLGQLCLYGEFMVTASCGWQYCKLACYCICRPWPVVDVMEHE
jgi:hypothetical protein